MAFKFIVALAFVAVASAGLIPSHQGYHAAGHPVLIKSEDTYDPHPQYQFSYGVNDVHTGDVKNQIETRDGDVVKGEYSLIDADGYKRTVHYSADDVHGFNAVVHREPLGHVVKAVHTAPVAYAAAPAIVNSAHVGYDAPTAYTQTYAAAPVAYSQAPVAYSHAPAAYTTQTLVKSSPVSYAAPAYAYHH
ncbi:larval cuticle protein A2B-like [Episyrphus balteatus]|uniref:larval cuticle protein A2B-like n=1 Tax=Episyrphus balteatus TaxID=286459 RepID=UPI002485BC37|nr:larval cuticle protein A2B-like [Episyrphus balteatus]